jgi:ankyrin repeat protein
MLQQYYFIFQNNTTALIVAASKGKLYFVRELIKHGADVNAEDAVSHYQMF